MVTPWEILVISFSVIEAQSIAGMMNSFHRKSVQLVYIDKNWKNSLTSLCIRNVNSWAATESVGNNYDYGTVIT
jgi:hypothetical protein